MYKDEDSSQTSPWLVLILPKNKKIKKLKKNKKK